jgi:hypothetical protein
VAKTSGLGATVSVADSTPAAQDITDDVTNFQFASPRAVQDVTGVDKSAMERLLLLADASMTLNGVFDAATSKAHDVFKTITSTSVARAVVLTVATKTWTTSMLLTDYPLTRAAGGELTFAVPGVLTGGSVPVWG